LQIVLCRDISGARAMHDAVHPLMKGSTGTPLKSRIAEEPAIVIPNPLPEIASLRE